MKTLMCTLFVICSTIIYAQQTHTIVSKISTGNDDAEICIA